MLLSVMFTRFIHVVARIRTSLSNKIPLYGHIVFYLPLDSSMGTWVVLFGYCVLHCFGHLCTHFCKDTYFHVSRVRYLGVELWDDTINLGLTYEELPTGFQSSAPL